MRAITMSDYENYRNNKCNCINDIFDRCYSNNINDNSSYTNNDDGNNNNDNSDHDSSYIKTPKLTMIMMTTIKKLIK